MLRDFLYKYASEAEINIEVTIFSKAIAFLESYSSVFELILLDIQMPDVNGVRVAEKIRMQDKSVIIVFVTNMVQYAVKGYKVDALDFILKPVSYFEFSSMMNKVTKKLHQRKEESLVICTKRKTVRVLVSQIMYMEAQGHKIFYYTENEEIESWDSLSAVEEQLPKEMFSKVNAGTIVNLNYVVGISGEVALLYNNKAVSISRRRKKEFIAELARFFGEKKHV